MAVLCAKRLQRTGIQLVMATSNDESDDTLSTLADRFGVGVFRGSLDDVLSRFTACASDLSGDDIIVRMTADNAVPDGAFVERLVEAFVQRGSSYLGTQSSRCGLPYGVNGEVFTVSELREADEHAKSPFEREHVTPYLRARAGATGLIEEGYFCSRNLSHLRCTIDTFTDYISIARVFEQLEDPIGTDWRAIVSLLPENKSPTERPIAVQQNGIMSRRVMLGSAQFGMSYGIANLSGCPSDEELQAIVATALSSGVSCFDTARVYGNAENRIGKLLPATCSPATTIVTKLAPLTDYSDDVGPSIIARAVDASVFHSCHALQRQRIDVMMFHRSADMFRWNGAALDQLALLVMEGVIGELGVSVYTPAEAIQCIGDDRIEHIQIPFNILDNRWLCRDFQAAIKSKPNLKIHARSVFLQGLLLNEHSIWPTWFTESEDIVSRIRKLCVELGRKSIADLCMGYVRSFAWVSTMVLGVERLEQLAQLLKLDDEPPLSQADVKRVRAAFQDIPSRLLNPGMWQ